MELPKPLIDNLREGNVILFLGAGASIGATHPQNKPVPTGKQLAKTLADKFLGAGYSDVSLLKAAELSIAQTNLITVQEFIASIFRDFTPASFHRLISSFMWKAIITTNYDLIIESVYEQDSRLQNIAKFLKNTDRVEEKLKVPNTIQYMKLHGCITVTGDLQIPLILTTEQYLTHRKNRNFLFERFTQLAFQYPVVYIGSNLDDTDIRAILQELRENSEVIPRSYIVLPHLRPAEKTFWEQYPFLSCIDMTFEDFIGNIDSAIPKTFRGIVQLKGTYEHPICERFAVTETTIKDNLQLLVSRDAEYINKNYQPTTITPQEFYKGYFKDFSPIIYNFDIRRTITDNLLSEIFLADETTEKQQFLYLIKGHAGSGKTVFMQRLAWDAATVFGRLCLWLKTDLIPDYDALVDLYRLCNERIYVIADPAHKYIDTIELWLTKARADKLPLTIIAAERNHEWNVACNSVYQFVTEVYELKYLNESEIESLLKKLAEHKSLGYLSSLSFDRQKEELTQIAGRQLLVALYEATLGRPFEEIILNEFKSISPPQAQSLYLTICLLHRLGIPTRAGLISRVHGIPFEEFQKRFFKPLDFIVFTHNNKIIGDYEYRSRHRVIAEKVFERVLVNEQDRFDEYMRLLKAVDIGFSSDREAFIRFTNATELINLFKNTQFIRGLFKAANDRIGDDPLLLQQEAIFEMKSTDGSLDKAGELLRKALEKQPSNRMIKHSRAEWALKKAEKSSSLLEKSKYRQESHKMAVELTQGDCVSAYPFHTIIKIGLDELTEILATSDETTFERKVSEIEGWIAQGKQDFPDDSFILSEESRFCELINNHPRATATLEKAFAANKGSPFIAVRLAHLYERNGQYSKAIQVLSECIDAKPWDKYANYNLAMLLMQYCPEKRADIKLHLRRSFTDGDINYAAQFWYARFLFLEDLLGEAKRFFEILNQAPLDPQVKNELKGIVTDNGNPVRFHGIISKKEHSYGFIKRDGYQDTVFMHLYDTDESIWDQLKDGIRVVFEMGFSYRGPRARNVSMESANS